LRTPRQYININFKEGQLTIAFLVKNKKENRNHLVVFNIHPDEIMKYLSIIVLSFSLLLSCKKPKDRVEKREDENSKLTVKEHFAVATNVSSWKNYKEKKVDGDCEVQNTQNNNILN